MSTSLARHQRLREIALRRTAVGEPGRRLIESDPAAGRDYEVHAANGGGLVGSFASFTEARFAAHAPEDVDFLLGLAAADAATIRDLHARIDELEATLRLGDAPAEGDARIRCEGIKRALMSRTVVAYHG